MYNFPRGDAPHPASRAGRGQKAEGRGRKKIEGEEGEEE